MTSKIWIFILLISLLHFVSSFPSATIDRNNCKSRKGDFPKLGSLCRSYYSCKDWIPKEKVCPGDQHFFPAKGYCVWPEEYPCLEKPKSKECPLPNGKFLKNGTECKVFYDCCNGIPTEKKCGKGLLFDHIRGKCDWPEYVTCPEGTKSKECIRRNGKFLKPGTKCKTYYECRDGISKERRCPDGQVFDPDAEKCEWPEIYTCVEDVSTTKSTTHLTSTLSTTVSTLVTTTTKGKISTTTNRPISTKIVTTDSGEDSSEGSSSSSEEGNTSEEGNSSQEDKQYSTKPVTKTTPSIISTTSGGGFTESPEGLTSSTESTSTLENSSKAVTSAETIQDSSTISLILTTSSTDENDIKIYTYSEVVTDGTTEIPEGLTSSTEPSSTGESSSKAVTSTAATEDTSTISLISTTRSTNDYSIRTNTYPEVVTEETRSEVTETDKNKDKATTAITTGLTDSITSHIYCPKPNGLFPHPNDRHKFLACVGDNYTIMDCPANLVFDYKKGSCQYDVKR